MNFQGEYNNSIDLKGRASIPARLRDVLSEVYGDERLVVTKRNSGLVAYPVSEWQKIKENVEGMPSGPTKDDIQRVLISPAIDCSFDKQGRIQLSQPLRSYGGLEKEIVVVGMINKIEIWSQIRHAEVTRESEKRLSGEGQAQMVADLGF